MSKINFLVLSCLVIGMLVFSYLTGNQHSSRPLGGIVVTSPTTNITATPPPQVQVNISTNSVTELTNPQPPPRTIYDNLSGKSAQLTLDNLDPTSQEYREIAFLIEKIEEYDKLHPEIKGREPTQEEKNDFVFYMQNTLSTSEFSDLLNRTFQGSQNTKLDTNYYLEMFLGRFFNTYSTKTQKNELVQCLGWQALVGDLIFFHYEGMEVARLGHYNLSFPSDIKQVRHGDIQLLYPKNISDIQKGDTYIYDHHTGLVLNKYLVEGELYFLVTEANSPRGAEEFYKPEGKPVLFIADERKFIQLLEVNGTVFARPTDRYQTVIPADTPSEDILNLIKQIQ